MMSLRTGTHQSAPTLQGLPNNIMHLTRIMGLGFSRWWLRAGDDERSKDWIGQFACPWPPIRLVAGSTH
jgi:hypothetical protein